MYVCITKLTYNYENNDCGLDTVNSLIADDIKITNIEPTSEENTK